ncbi:MAG TPA: Ig-like domain-containing protein [Thermoanaerobaculia bacterium]|nr:Ig-like domain-containing protein [Thermoanaerobaculia bacterium]
MRHGSRAEERRLGPARALGLALALILLAACGPRDGGAEAEPPRLRLDDDPTSETFGAVLLGPLPDLDLSRLDALALDERALLEESSTASASAPATRESSAPIVLWTGRVDLDPRGGCVHPHGQASVLGALRAQSEHLAFVPRIGPVPGLTYTACADLEEVARLLPQTRSRIERTTSILRLSFTPEGADADAPRVVSIWPTSTTVPENLLRIYVAFSEPMAARDVGRRVHLLDAAGETVSEAFVDVPNGLWDARFTRLTLFLHPGRVKRGVGPHRELGPTLVAGSTVTLRIEGDLTSRRGEPLGRTFEHSYAVAPADRSSPDPERWELVVPTAPDAPVTVRFDEPLDRAQLLRFVTVLSGGARQPVQGRAVAAEDGTAWSFTPSHRWPAGRHRVVVQRAIEDLAGNTVDRLFDVKTLASVEAAEGAEVAFPGAGGEIELPFTATW